jgi:hypothetical protein
LYEVFKFVTFLFELSTFFSEGKEKMADDKYYLDALIGALDEDENEDFLCASTDNGDVQQGVMNDEDCHRPAPSADMQEWCPSLVHQDSTRFIQVMKKPIRLDCSFVLGSYRCRYCLIFIPLFLFVNLICCRYS